MVRTKARAVVENRDMAVVVWVTDFEQVKGHLTRVVSLSRLSQKLLNLSRLLGDYHQQQVNIVVSGLIKWESRYSMVLAQSDDFRTGQDKNRSEKRCRVR